MCVFVCVYNLFINIHPICSFIFILSTYNYNSMIVLVYFTAYQLLMGYSIPKFENVWLYSLLFIFSIFQSNHF